ncbi:uncharacterized protein LOC118216099 [Anguilla anguilla]|uniref:uncharacterized protein LOC118216099 n=1 Tax=Anguilla anguilla TaxID=7936 RepID=UPI0015AAAF7C|nr:uncharacterized protein LOC118216099 [Anguilla anguilla]
MTASDIESLQPRASSGGRCLHAFLITSVITLFVLLFGVTVTAALFIRQIQTELLALSNETHGHTERTAYADMLKSEHKVKNFAFLRAKSGGLEDETMDWHAEAVGSGFTYYEQQRTLQPQRSGSYLLYLDLALRCTANKLRNCSSVTVTVTVQGTDSLLECRATGAGAGASTGTRQGLPVKCWTVVQLKPQQRLVAVMEARGNTPNWELVTVRSGMGMFLVDGQRD